VRFSDFLHLKSVVTRVGPETVLLNGLRQAGDLRGLQQSRSTRPTAGRVASRSAAVIFPVAYPRTAGGSSGRGCTSCALTSRGRQGESNGHLLVDLEE
jgi:hypothetical protein